MKKQLTALLTSVALISSAIPAMHIYANSEEVTVKQMEYLDRGTVAAKVSGGVYLSWRLLGTESLSNQAFDIYRDGQKIYTTDVHDATCYTDPTGSDKSEYVVVPANTSPDGEKAVTPLTTNVEYSKDGFSNSVAHIDIPFTAPEGGTTPTGEDYTYSANDMSVGDLDGDGEYELIVKWDPSNSKDNSQSGYTGNVYIDAYKLDGTQLWRMNLGQNIRAGAHYTQYIVYDFDGDGRSEIAFKTAPGSKDGLGNYVTIKGKDIEEADNERSYADSNGIIFSGPEYLSIFDGETGMVLQTINYDPPRSINTSKEWEDNRGLPGSRSERYLAGVAYLDGKTPSLIEVRGYYTYAYVSAYKWDGENLTQQWLSSNGPNSSTVRYADGSTQTQDGKTLYGQGAHSLSVADVDNDTFDEIIFGSAILDHDGTVLLYDGRGHGDSEHVSDFDNDGQQEIFMVHEAGKGNDSEIPYAVDIKRYNGDVTLQAAVGDIGRGVMANIDDDYAVKSGNLSTFWSVASDGIFNQSGERVGNIPSSNSNYENFFVYWDGDLGRELLDGNKLSKHDIENNTTTRIYYDRKNSSFPDVFAVNGTKANPGLVADIFGDWREEIVYPLYTTPGARIYFSTIPTEYRLTTLMHDSQYRCAVAWQNVAYNQPPHQSYYIGSASLAKNSDSTTLNYLAPTTTFDEIEYPDATDRTPVPIITPTPAPDIQEISVTKIRNEVEQNVNVASDKVYLSHYSGFSGLAYFGFGNITDFDPSEIVSAEVVFTAESYATKDRNRQFYFNIFSADNTWESGTVKVDTIPYPTDETPILSESCQTNYGNGDIIVPNREASFDITDYVKSFPEGTKKISLLVAVPAGEGGAGACELTMYNTPVLRIGYKPQPATPTPKVEKAEVIADADTYVIYNDSTTPFGNSSELKVNMARPMYGDATPGLKEATGLGLIRFDLSEYEGRELLSAKLNIYGKYTNTDSAKSDLHLDYCSQDDWDENTFTANDIILRGVGTPLSSTGILQTPVYSTSYQKLSFDVTDVIKADSDNVHTFTLWTGTAREQVIASKEYTGSDAKAPTLVLTYKEAEPTPTPTASPSPTPTASPSPTPTVSPSPTPTASPSPTPTASPSPTPTVSPSPTPTVSPSPTPTASPSPTPTASPSPTPTASPSAEPSTEPLPSYKYNITNAVIESDGVNVNIDVNESNTKKVYGLVALYNSEKALVGMSYEEIEISPDTESFKINIENIPEYQYMTVMIWNNIDEMEPLCQLFDSNR